MHSRPDSSVASGAAAPSTQETPDARPEGAFWRSGAGGTGDDTRPGILVRCAVVVAVAMVIGAGLGALFNVVRPSTWSASIGMRVTGNVASLVDPQQPSAPSRRDVLSEVDLMKSAPVSQRAQEFMGEGLPALRVTSGIDSDVVVLDVEGPTAEEASAAVTSYADAYDSMLSDQQSRVLTDEQNRLRTLTEEYSRQIDQLSGQFRGAPPETLATASALLIPLTEGLADSSRRLSRIDALLGGLPANTERLQPTAIARETSSSWVVDAAAGAVIAGAGAGLVLYRRYRTHLT
jgi:hypothetical protein